MNGGVGLVLILIHFLELVRAGGDEEWRGLGSCPFDDQVSDSALNECIQLGLEELRGYFANGLPHLGLGPFDPLHVEEVTVWPPQGDADTRRASRMEFVFHDIEARGISKYSREYAELNTAEKSVKLGFVFPVFHIKTGYRFAVQTGAFRVAREGTMVARLTSFHNNYTIFFRLEGGAGGQTLRPIRVTWGGTYDDVEIDLPEVRRGLVGGLGLTAAKQALKNVFSWTLTNLVPSYVGQVLEQHQSFVPAISHLFGPYFVQNRTKSQ